jgi:hypothetical protein
MCITINIVLCPHVSGLLRSGEATSKVIVNKSWHVYKACRGSTVVLQVPHSCIPCAFSPNSVLSCLTLGRFLCPVFTALLLPSLLGTGAIVLLRNMLSALMGLSLKAGTFKMDANRSCSCFLHRRTSQRRTYLVAARIGIEWCHCPVGVRCSTLGGGACMPRHTCHGSCPRTRGEGRATGWPC